MKTRVVVSIVSILVTSQWLLPSAVSAAQYYVHANKGKNSNSGTSPTKAFGDLSHALKQLRAGDTLHVRSGTYNSIPQLSPGIVRSGTGSQPIVLKAYGNERPIISGSNTIRLNGGISNWVIQGLTFNNASAVKLGVRNGNTTNCMSYADNITIKNNIFQNNSDGGIVLNCARNIKIENNDFFNLRSRKVGSDTHAILMTAQVSNATISGNQFTDIGADGVQMAGNIRNVAITDNTFEIVHPYRYRGLNGQVDSSNSKRFGSVGENAIDIKAGPGPFTITGNTIRGFRPVIKGTQDASGDMGVGIVLHQTSKKVFIRRNYFHDNVIHINMGTASAGSQVSHNIFDSTSQAESVYGSDTQIPKALLLKGVNGIDVYNNVFHNDSAQDKFLLRTVGADNILLQNNVFQNGRLWPTDTRYMKADYNAFSGITKDLDGMFKGPHDVSGSLRLNGSTWKPNSGSPLINAGIRMSNDVDYYGKSISGGSPDIGAAEFGGGSSSTQPTQPPQSSQPSQNNPSSSGSSGEYISILDLEDGDRVSGTITFKVDAQSPSGIKKVELWEDTKKLAVDTSRPYETRLNTKPYGSNQQLRLKAVAHLNNGDKLKTVVRVKTGS